MFVHRSVCTPWRNTCIQGTVFSSMSEYRSDQVLIKVPQPVKRLEILRFLDAVIGDQRLSGHSVALRIVTRVVAS